MFFITSSYFGMAFMVALLASSRGRSWLGWFCLACLASPIGAGLLLLARPNLKAEETARRELADSKVCPRCAETVRNAAFVCRFCGHEFAADDPPAEPSSPRGQQNVSPVSTGDKSPSGLVAVKANRIGRLPDRS